MNHIYEGHSHSFDTGIAKILGINAAIVFNHIVYWLRLNASKGLNIINEKVWMYETQQQIADFLEYMSLDEVKKAIALLIEAKLIIKDNFNKNPFDKTGWYTTTDQEILRIKKSSTKASYGSIGKALPLDPPSPTAPCIYKEQKEHIHNNKQQQHRKEAAPSAAAFPKEEEKKPKIYRCLEELDISLKDKIQITRDYAEKTVMDAIDWSTHPDNPPTKCLSAQIKFACKNGLSLKDHEKKTKETPYDRVKKLFSHGEIYNGAECYITEEYIAFVRGQKDKKVKLDQYFTWRKLEDLCDIFQINIRKLTE